MKQLSILIALLSSAALADTFEPASFGGFTPTLNAGIEASNSNNQTLMTYSLNPDISYLSESGSADLSGSAGLTAGIESQQDQASFIDAYLKGGSIIYLSDITRASVDGSVALDHEGDAAVTDADDSNRQNVTLSTNARFQIGDSADSTLMLVLGGGAEAFRALDSDFDTDDSTTISGSLAANYLLDDATALIASATVDQEQFANQDTLDNTEWAVNTGVAWSASEIFSVEVSAGYLSHSLTNNSAGDYSGLKGSAELNWSINEQINTMADISFQPVADSQNETTVSGEVIFLADEGLTFNASAESSVSDTRTTEFGAGVEYAFRRFMLLQADYTQTLPENDDATQVVSAGITLGF